MTAQRVPVAVLLGGPSAEHDVSLVSGRAIAGALAARGYPVSAWLIDLDGRWWALPAGAIDPARRATDYDDPASLGAEGPFTVAGALERLAAIDPAPIVFPALHGPFGEDGQVQALLESAGLAYCGSGPAASAIGMDKTLFKRACGSLELPVLPWVEVRALDWARDQRACLAELEGFAASLPDPRLVIKPARLGSSIGVTIVHRPDEPPELEHAVADALRYDDLLLAEPYLDHPRELEASIVGNSRHDLAVYGPGEILPGREFYDYVAKYRSDASRTFERADLDPAVREDVRRIAGEVFLATGCSGFARVDFLLGADDLLFVSEINTIPGFTPISLFPRMCAEGGMDFGDVCERIVRLAQERAAVRPVRRLTRADLP
ncbi:MAG: D-alanine--D-alanine ligase family protein [Chloroflexota bacterium]